MGEIQWSESLETGIEEMDAQHRQLIEIYNELHAAARIGKGHKQMREILGRLVAYTESHFTAEEEYMERIGFEDLERHRVEHSQLIEKVRLFVRKLDLDQERITKPVLEFLEGWLKKHIMGKDMEYAKAGTPT